MKLQTPVEINPIDNRISYRSKLLFMGSCFASEIGGIMQHLGFNVLLNPFGVLYNPASIASAIARLDSGKSFLPEDVLFHNGLYTSFHHHSSFSRESEEEFLVNANKSLQEASNAFKSADTCVITLGTAWLFRYIKNGMVVSNCHKLPASEFERFRLTVDETASILENFALRYPLKDWIFTVSPIRHLKDGAHGNQISKATLLLAIEKVTSKYANTHYFPAYEIMMDELRDYRFYCENMTHPTEQAINYIFEKFSEFAIDTAEGALMAEAEKRYRASLHRPMNKKS